MDELIICEKPSAARRIAAALAESKVETKKVGQVSYQIIKRGKKTITIVSAVGHLFTVGEKKRSFTYPSFDIDWKPSYTNKNSAFTKKYAEVIQKQAEKADSFTVACDFDIEGEVIGLNVVRFLCNQKDAERMKFSTLTKPDLIHAYENKTSSIEWGMAKAGETRHFLDWMYGINLSRALTLAIRKSKVYKTMSSGRVQGPALRILAEREKEIQVFIPKKYWQLQLLGKRNQNKIEAWHKEDKFWEEEKANVVLEKTKNKDGAISDIKKTETTQYAPFPFDLTTLQTESYRNFGFTPKRTLDIAQELYSKGYISYPRTSSQQLPYKIGFKKIITTLMKQAKYIQLGKLVVSKALKPNNGKKTDPAHPAIYPTGIIPKSLDGQNFKLYDLIVKRFFATFGEKALRETITVNIDVNKESFVAKGTRTKVKGWHVLYEPYVKLKEEELPELNKGDKITVDEINKLEKETQPPKRFTQASIIKELEKRGLGTKSTRAQIIENLIDRNYVEGKTLEVSEIGMKTISTLEKYSPDIISDDLTKRFEQEMKKIRTDKKGQAKTIQEARQKLVKILDNFKRHELEIGKQLAEAYSDFDTLGQCPVCKKGNLKIKHSRKNNSRFIACDKYPDCTTTFSLPRTGNVKTTDKECSECKYPLIKIGAGRKIQEVCINPNCKSKENGDNSSENEKCPKCGEGQLVLRTSIYGKFYACNKYPKCKYIKGNGKSKPKKSS